MEIIGILLAVAIGFTAGILSGLFGIGGGIIMVPAMIAAGLVGLTSPALAFGQATAASLFAIIFISPTGSYVHFREKHLNLRYGIVLGTAGITGGVLGSFLSKSLDQNILETAFGIFAIFMGIQIMLKNKRDKKPVAGPDGKPCRVDDDTKESTECTMRNPYPVLVCVGFCAGILAGIMGVGGGLIMVPIMVLLGVGIHVAIGTSLLAIIFTASASVITKASFNLLDIWLAIPLAVGGCIAAYTGAVIASRTTARELSKYFSVLLFFISAYMIARGLELIK